MCKPLGENYETLLREIKEGPVNGAIMTCLQIGGLTSMKMSVFPKWPIDSAQSQWKSQRLFCRNWQAGPKFMWKFKDLEVPKETLKRNKVGALSISDFRTYYKPSKIKTVWYWPKDRQIDQWNRIKSPRNKDTEVENGREDTGSGKGKLGRSKRVAWTDIHYQM